MKGYYNNPEETDMVLKTHSDGSVWLHLSDTGYIDEDGQVFHIDRKKNIFMRIGFNVHPAKVADSIKTLSIVSDCTVIGYEHPEQQMVPVAFIKLTRNQHITEKDAINAIDEFCLMNLEQTSVPVRYIIVDNIPYNLGGKIDVNKLRETYNISF